MVSSERNFRHINPVFGGLVVGLRISHLGLLPVLQCSNNAYCVVCKGKKNTHQVTRNAQAQQRTTKKGVTTFAGKNMFSVTFTPVMSRFLASYTSHQRILFVMFMPSSLEKIRLLRGYCKLDLHSRQRLKPLHCLTVKHGKKRKRCDAADSPSQGKVLSRIS